MRLIQFLREGTLGVAVASGDTFRGWTARQPSFPGDLDRLVQAGPDALAAACRELMDGEEIDLDAVAFLPPLMNPGKIFCVGLNYLDHSIETGLPTQEYPTVFARFASSLIAHAAPLVMPVSSDAFDWEGEMVAVIGRGGRNISQGDALEHIVAYSIFNDASVRDYQMKTSQWTMGKNFDGTGAFGPWLTTADSLPLGGRGLMLTTRLNGAVVQSASTDDMIFDIATLVTTLSEVATLNPGDVIVTGTPSGVGMARKPPMYMKPGDMCEVEIEGIGVLQNIVTRAT